MRGLNSTLTVNNIFKWRYAVWTAYSRLKHNDTITQPGAERHYARILVAHARYVVKITDKEKLQKHVDFYGLSKPDIAWAIQEYIRRIKIANETCTSHHMIEDRGNAITLAIHNSEKEAKERDRLTTFEASLRKRRRPKS
jgi:hypothetical protein